MGNKENVHNILCRGKPRNLVQKCKIHIGDFIAFRSYEQQFKDLGIWYEHRLIDDMVSEFTG